MKKSYSILLVLATFLSYCLPGSHAETLWSPSAFEEVWIISPVEGYSSMTLIEDEESGRLFVAMRLIDGGTANGDISTGWDALGELVNWTVCSSSSSSVPTQMAVVDGGGDLVDISLRNAVIAGTLVGPGGEIHISGLAVATMAQKFSMPPQNFANIYLLPVHLHESACDAESFLSESMGCALQGSGAYYDEAMSVVSVVDNEYAVGSLDLGSGTVMDCWAEFLEDMDYCREQYNENRWSCEDDHTDEVNQCSEKLVNDRRDCEEVRDGKQVEADARRDACIDNVGIVDTLLVACAYAGGGGAAGMGIGTFIFPGVGTGAGGMIGGCVGIIGGVLHGKNLAMWECEKGWNEDVAALDAAFDYCRNRAFENFDACLYEASDKYGQCIDKARGKRRDCEDIARILYDDCVIWQEAQ